MFPTCFVEGTDPHNLQHLAQQLWFCLRCEQGALQASRSWSTWCMRAPGTHRPMSRVRCSLCRPRCPFSRRCRWCSRAQSPCRASGWSTRRRSSGSWWWRFPRWRTRWSRRTLPPVHILPRIRADHGREWNVWLQNGQGCSLPRRSWSNRRVCLDVWDMEGWTVHLGSKDHPRWRCKTTWRNVKKHLFCSPCEVWWKTWKGVYRCPTAHPERCPSIQARTLLEEKDGILQFVGQSWNWGNVSTSPVVIKCKCRSSSPSLSP